MNKGYRARKNGAAEQTRHRRRNSMKKWMKTVGVVLALHLLTSIAHSQVKIKGYMYGEYYVVLHHNSGSVDEGGIEGRHGFWFRRIYFTADSRLAANLEARLRFEMNSPGKLPFDSSDRLTAVVKDAYLSYATGGQELRFGIISTPTWGHNIEDIWGYRSVEKTPLDLMKLGSSRDFGIGLKGHLDEGKTVNYYIMFGNGASNKGETDQGKKIYGSLAFKPKEHLVLEIYTDYEHAAHEKRYRVIQGFAAYQGEWGRAGAMYARRQFKQSIEDGKDKENDYNIFSAFAVFNAAKNVEIIARFDRMFGDGFESNFRGESVSYIPFASNPGAPFHLLIAGVSWNAAKNVWLIPNIKYVFYSEPDEGEKPSGDVYANFTVWFKF
ncbi:MAG: hypothetical protein ACE5L7_02640 [Candidatus Aminicenantales bacterium]